MSIATAVATETASKSWAFSMTSDLFGIEVFESYDSEEEAIAGYKRVIESCSKGEYSDVERHFSLGYIDDDGEFVEEEELDSYPLGDQGDDDEDGFASSLCPDKPNYRS